MKPVYVYIDPKTLQPESSGKRYVFCSDEHKEKWLNSPRDICLICMTPIKTESPLNECLIVEDIEFYLCPIHRKSNWRDEVMEQINESIEEWREIGVLEDLHPIVKDILEAKG